jgi:hypothetical protein
LCEKLQRLHRWLPLASFSRKTVERSFFRKPGLSQAIDNDRRARLCNHLIVSCGLTRRASAKADFASASFPFAASAPAKYA